MTQSEYGQGGVSGMKPELISLEAGREEVRHLQANLIGAFISAPAGAALILIVLGGEEGQFPRLLGWFAAVLLWTALRCGFYLLRRAETAGEFDPLPRRRIESVLILGAGVIWGVLPLLFAHGLSPREEMFVIFMVAGMGTGGSYSYAALPIAAQGFLAAAVMPVAALNLFGADAAHFPIGFMLALYYILMAVSTRNNSRTVRGAIMLALEKSAMADGLRFAKGQAEENARQLADEVEERKNAEATLQEAYSLLSGVLEASPLAIVVFAPDVTVKIWTKGAERLFGWRADEVVGRKLPVVRDADMADFQRTLQKVMDGGALAGIQAQRVRKDGSAVEVEAAIAPQRDAAGKVSAFIAIVNDIGVRKEMEARLREEQERFAFLTHVAEEGIVVSEEGVLVDANPRLLQLFNYESREEVLGHPILEFIAPESRDHVAVLLARGARDPYEALVMKKGGERFLVEVNGKEVLYRGRSLRIAVVRDITERKRMEMVLRESEEKFRTLVNSMEDGVFVLDPEQRFTGFYGNWLARHSVTEDEFIGRTFRQMFGAAVGALHEGPARRALQGETVHYEWPLEYEDVQVYYHTTLSPLRDSGGAVIGIVGVGRDITRLKEKEEELRKAKETAEEATKLKDKFVSLVAHDLKSPFASILASLQVITRYERENFSEDGLSMMEGALSSGMNLVRMIDDLLNISRLQTGKIAMNKRFIDPHALVGRLIAARLGIAQQKGVGIINRIPSGTFLYCDPDLMGEVLQNLLTNAVKFTPKGGMVEIGMPKGDPAAIFVKDNGVGIPPGMLPNLFKHEEKTSTPGTEGERGTGLGLPLSFDIMRAHGGELSVVSAPAEGSTITARLPYVRPVVVAVDDDPTGRIFMAESLKKLGVSVFTASGADDAMLAMAKTEPHLLVTDIIMPEKDGFYLIDAVRKSRPRLPILAITADNEQGIRERVLDAGADDFVTKHAIGDDLNFRAMRLLLSH